MLGGKLACLSTFVYILLGAVGLPVFSSFSGGMGKLMGPTGGYIIGFIPMALLCGFAVSKWSNKKVLLAIIMAVGTLIAYLVGTVWFVHIQQCDIMHALEICVFPFLIPDAIKIVIAILLGGEVRKRLILLNYLDVEK